MTSIRTPRAKPSTRPVFTEELQTRISEYWPDNPHKTIQQIADHFGLSVSGLQGALINYDSYRDLYFRVLVARELLLDELLWDAALNGVNAQDRALIDVRIRMKGILNRTKAARIGLSTEHNKLEVVFVCADKDEDDDEP